MSLHQKLKKHVFLSYIIFSISSGNKCAIIKYIGNNVLYEKLKIGGF